MKKVVQNVLLVATVLGGTTVAYGPSAEARNYGAVYPNWQEECLGADLLTVVCSFEESTEQYKNGSYKEEVINEPADVAVHREEAWEIASAGLGHRSYSWDNAYKMRDDFAGRLGRTVDWSAP